MKELFQKLVKTGDEIYAKICEVISINEEEKLADVKPLDGEAVIHDIYLMVDDEKGGIYQKPKKGSFVCIVFIQKDTGILVGTSELEKFNIKLESTEFEINKDGFLLKRENESLKILIDELFETIKRMKFTTNTGSTIQLVNISEFTELQKRFKTILN